MLYVIWGEANWANLKKLSDIVESIEKQANKKYDQLQVDVTQTPQVARTLNEMEVV